MTTPGIPAPIAAPCTITVELPCPNCDDVVFTEARLQARVTRDSDGSGALALRVRSAKASHLCNQPTLGLAEGPRER